MSGNRKITDTSKKKKIAPYINKRKNAAKIVPTKELAPGNNSENKNAEMYVLSPDILKRWGVKIPPMQDSSNSVSSPKENNIAKIKQSLQRKILKKVEKKQNCEANNVDTDLASANESALPNTVENTTEINSVCSQSSTNNVRCVDSCESSLRLYEDCITNTEDFNKECNHDQIENTTEINSVCSQSSTSNVRCVDSCESSLRIYEDCINNTEDFNKECNHDKIENKSNNSIVSEYSEKNIDSNNTIDSREEKVSAIAQYLKEALEMLRSSDCSQTQELTESNIQNKKSKTICENSQIDLLTVDESTAQNTNTDIAEICEKMISNDVPITRSINTKKRKRKSSSNTLKKSPIQNIENQSNGENTDILTGQSVENVNANITLVQSDDQATASYAVRKSNVLKDSSNFNTAETDCITEIEQSRFVDGMSVNSLNNDSIVNREPNIISNWIESNGFGGVENASLTENIDSSLCSDFNNSSTYISDNFISEVAEVQNTIITKKTRSRRSRNVEPIAENSTPINQTRENSTNDNDKNESVGPGAPPSHKKAGRPKKGKVPDEDEPKPKTGRQKKVLFENIREIIVGQWENNEFKHIPDLEDTPNKRGRPAKADVTKSVTYYKKLKSMKCKCMVCLKEIPRSNWYYHKGLHNFLAWTEDEEPINLDDETVVINILKQKLNKDKKILCEKCLTTRMSYVGFLYHLIQCQKTKEEIENLKQPCPICKNMMLPQSLKLHLPTHKRATMVADVEPPVVEENVSDTSLGRGRRRAAQKAVEYFKTMNTEPTENQKEKSKLMDKLYKRVMKNPVTKAVMAKWRKQVEDGEILQCINKGCKQTNENYKSISMHCRSSCSFKPKTTFLCSICKYACKELSKIKEHLTDNHDDVLCDPSLPNDLNDTNYDVESSTASELSELSDDEDSDICLPKRKSTSGGNIPNTARCIVKSNFQFAVNKEKWEYHKWHKKLGREFASSNFSTARLFDNFTCNKYSSMTKGDAEKFLPTVQSSCNVSHALCDDKSFDTPKDINWKKYNLFESELHNDATTFWCGGPVWSLAWIPGDRSKNFLVVAADKHMENRYHTNQCYSHNGIVQIWDVGVFDNENKACETPATMAYGIAHDHGVVWDMDFCPSGCSDDLQNTTINDNHKAATRIGLLAIACSNGNAYVYAIAQPDSLRKSASRIYSTTPSIKLMLDTKTIQIGYKASHATKISWSKMKGHNIIAVGYSSGVVGLFDITTKSTLISKIENNTVCLLPYFTFQPYLSSITGLSLLPLNNRGEENKIILCIASKSGVGMWDGARPLVNKIGCFASMTSVHPWPQIISCLDELRNSGASMHIVCPSFVTNGGVDISSSLLPGGGVCNNSMWYNGYVTASDMGEVILRPVHTPLVYKHRIVHKVRVIKKAVLSYAKTFSLKGPSPGENRCTYSKDVNKMFQLSEIISQEFMSDAITYEDAEQSYGLLFVDVKQDALKAKKFQPKLAAQPPDRWNLQSFLSVQTNPEQNKYLFYAVGGRTGHVRILCASHITPDCAKFKESSSSAYF